MDALTVTGYFREGGKLEAVLAKGEIVEGAAMLCGSVAGGVIAQATNLGVPYMLRAVVLGVTFVLAFVLMRDVGLHARAAASARVERSEATPAADSIDAGLRQSAGALDHARRPVHRRRDRSTRSTRCSRTCWSCTATRARTPLPGSPPRSSQARRSRAVCSCR